MILIFYESEGPVKTRTVFLKMQRVAFVDNYIYAYHGSATWLIGEFENKDEFQKAKKEFEEAVKNKKSYFDFRDFQ